MFLSFSFPTKILYVFLNFPIYTTFSSHIILYWITLIKLCEHCELLGSSLYTFPWPHFISSLLGQNNIFSMLSLNILNLRFSLK